MCLLILRISNDLQKLKLSHIFIHIISVHSLGIAHAAFLIFCYVKA